MNTRGLTSQIVNNSEIWQVFNEVFDLWLEEARMQLESLDALTDDQVKLLRVRCCLLRKFKTLPTVIDMLNGSEEDKTFMEAFKIKET